MDWAGRVLVPGRTDHDQCRGHDLDPAEHDEHAVADGDGACRGQTDASSHTLNASWLTPAEQRALMRWEICGT
jgi:hypothetical protein